MFPTACIAMFDNESNPREARCFVPARTMVSIFAADNLRTFRRKTYEYTFGQPIKVSRKRTRIFESLIKVLRIGSRIRWE